MNFKISIRGVAYLVVAIALLATAMALNDREYPPANTLQTRTLASTNGLDAKLARCKALGIGAENDADCKAVWWANRERFLDGKEFYQDRVFVPAKPDPNGPNPASAGKFTAPAERAGQPQ